MTNQTVDLNKEQIYQYTTEAALIAGYENGFGIQGCDLSKPIWWVAYCRQSLDE